MPSPVARRHSSKPRKSRSKAPSLEHLAQKINLLCKRIDELSKTKNEERNPTTTLFGAAKWDAGKTCSLAPCHNFHEGFLHYAPSTK